MKHVMKATFAVGILAAAGLGAPAFAQTTSAGAPSSTMHNAPTAPATAPASTGTGTTMNSSMTGPSTPNAAMNAPSTTSPSLGANSRVGPKSDSSAPAAVTTTSAPSRTTKAPVAGANSFTQSEARSRIQDSGFGNVTGLKKDAKGVWRGTAMKDGKSMQVALDYQGNITSK